MVNSTEVSVLHGFEFPTYCSSIEVSHDNKTLLATGGYKPMNLLFDLQEHSLKTERHSDHELLKGIFLEEDWTKMAFLSNTARIEFHSQFGKHEIISLPQQCRDIKADRIKAEVLAPGKLKDVYRFSLETGKFSSITSTGVTSIEEVAINTSHTLCAVAGSARSVAAESSGLCEFIDSRDNSIVGKISVDSPATSCAFSDDGILFAAGSESGVVSLYDIRSAKPMITKDHNYDFRIKKVQIKGRRVLSLDRKGVKVWECSTGKVLATIQPAFEANTFATSEGIVFIGGSTEEMKTYYTPSLGAIPAWCSNLEGATDEMDEMRKTTYFEQYRFVTEEELAAARLQKEVGKKVKPHMHGYLVPHALYDKHIEKLQAS
ncbi:ribosome biogenesis protein ENP2 [Nematocida major]|uniref:ribosome biogenesis protein ENP2 n=1 Tax=Nematocida major TaxID=1912982 RepID=UPI0020077F47|nr:ribosome biogenesis protein ENP2 [Nematocida major]KAH9386879.1 ribosome biogenesis protein ENP2 [Nematocida major]